MAAVASAMAEAARRIPDVLDEVRMGGEHRELFVGLADTLHDLAGVLGVSAGTRRAVVAREITKRFEEFRRGTIAELAAAMREHPPRGEVVLLIEGRAAEALDEEALRESAQALRSSGATTREIARSLVERHGAPRNLAYRVAQDA